MFRWLARLDPDTSGLSRMRRQFDQMLEDGRHMVDMACNVFLGGGDLEVIREELFSTDRRINETERLIRREIVVHGTVHGPAELPVCLVLMSIVKDAERVGDYAKNLFDLAAVRPKDKGDRYYDDLVKLKARVSDYMRRAREAYLAEDAAEAKKLLAEGDRFENDCDRRVTELLAEDPGTAQPAATVLAYRYLKRVVAHTLNIVTSLVVPIDRLDFLDEKEPRGAARG